MDTCEEENLPVFTKIFFDPNEPSVTDDQCLQDKTYDPYK